MTTDEQFAKLGEWLQKNNISNKRFSVATELREYLKHTIVDAGAEVEIGLDMFSGDIILKPIINDEQMIIWIGYVGPNKKPPKRKRKVKS